VRERHTRRQKDGRAIHILRPIRTVAQHKKSEAVADAGDIKATSRAAAAACSNDRKFLSVSSRRTSSMTCVEKGRNLRREVSACVVWSGQGNTWTVLPSTACTGPSLCTRRIVQLITVLTRQKPASHNHGIHIENRPQSRPLKPLKT